MNFHKLINTGASISLTIGANDLREFAQTIAAKTRQEIEQEIAENKSEAYYTADRVSEIFSVDRTTLWRWAKRSYLVPIKVGGLIRYRKSDVDRILNHGKK